MNKMTLKEQDQSTLDKTYNVNYELVSGRKNIIRQEEDIIKTINRAQIGSQKSILPRLDQLPMLDRSLVDYSKYHKYVGHAGRKNFMAIQATRGCPYKCFYCDIYKTTVIHYRRSVENIMEEVKMIADLAVIAEGELTIADILERSIRNGNNFPDKEELKEIPGIAF